MAGDDFIPEDPIGPEPEHKPLLERTALFAVNHIFSLFICVLILVLGLIFWLSRGTLPTTLGQYNQIANGMTEKEVQQILGFAANAQPVSVPAVPISIDEHPIWKAWDDGQTTIIIGFVDGKVRYKHRTDSPKR
jgi:hypothetical protein